MPSERDGGPWTWRIGLLLLVPTAAVLIYLATRGRDAGVVDEDAAEREAMVELERALRDADEVDFGALPRDLATLDHQRALAYLFRGFEECGSIDLAGFEGDWRPMTPDEQWTQPRVFDGRVQAGSWLRMELCAVHVVEREADRLLTLAVWHEDVHDPGDASLTYLELRRRGATLEVRFGDDRDALSGEGPVVLAEGAR